VTLTSQQEARFKILREARPNTWIAFNEDETQLAGQGETYLEAVEEAHRNGCDEPVITLIPPDWGPMALCG